MIWLAPFALWASLFDQSVVRILTRDFPQAQFVLIDVETEQLLGRRWSGGDAIPMGSLMKPFTALALASDSGKGQCDSKQCWLATGHGNIDLPHAIAQSCNSYFLQKGRGISEQAIFAVARQFHLPPPEDASPTTLIGLGSGWKVLPDDMAQAFAALAKTPEARRVLEGMRLAALSGTAQSLGGKALAKTGTAPCSHRQQAPGDGYVAILYPPAAPKYMLLVQVHGVSGAEATRTAARMLDVLRHGK